MSESTKIPRMAFSRSQGPFGGARKLPDIFHNDFHLVLIEHRSGQREYVHAITGSYGDVKRIDDVHSNTTFVRVDDGGFFMDQNGKVRKLEL